MHIGSGKEPSVEHPDDGLEGKWNLHRDLSLFSSSVCNEFVLVNNNGTVTALAEEKNSVQFVSRTNKCTVTLSP